MIQSIKEYAAKNNTLFFLEACYPTIAIKNKLTYIKNTQEFLHFKKLKKYYRFNVVGNNATKNKKYARLDIGIIFFKH